MPKKTIILLLSLLFFLITTPLFATTITLVEFNDFHGQLEQKNENPGMVKFAGAIENTLKNSPNPILISGGDNYQGSMISDLTFGKPVNLMFKHLGLTVSAVGNHEFDLGISHFAAWEKTGHFKYVGANIYDKKTNKPVTWLAPYILVKKAGIIIAFIGISTQETTLSTNPQSIKNIIFKDDAKSAQHWINYLKSGKDPAGKPDAIIALTHIPSVQDEKTQKITGQEINYFCRHIHGVTAVISAHRHLAVDGEINHIPVIQAMKYGQAIGKITLVFNDKNQLVQVKHDLDLIYLHQNQLPSDSFSQTIYDHYFALFSKMTHQVLGRINQNLTKAPYSTGHSTFGQFICNAIKSETGLPIVLINQGLMRNDLMAGNISISYIYAALPFDNPVVTLSIKGSNLLEILKYGTTKAEHQSKQAEFIGINVSVSPVFSATLANGQKIRPNQYYSITSLQYLLDGGDGYSFKEIKNIQNTERSARDFVIDYIKKLTKDGK